VNGKIIASASVGRPSSGSTKQTWGSFSPPLTRSGGERCALRGYRTNNHSRQAVPREASPDRFDSGSFVLPYFGRVVGAKAMMLHNHALASVWEVPCSRLSGGDARLTKGSW